MVIDKYAYLSMRDSSSVDEHLPMCFFSGDAGYCLCVWNLIGHMLSFQPAEPRREGKQAVHLLWLHFWCFSSLCLYKCYTFLIFFCLRFLITSLLSLFSTSYYTTVSKTAELNTDTYFASIKTEIALWEIHIMIMTGSRLYLQRFLCPPLRYTIKKKAILSHNRHFRIQFPLSNIAWCYCFAFCVCLLLSLLACTGKHVIVRILLWKWNEVKIYVLRKRIQHYRFCGEIPL